MNVKLVLQEDNMPGAIIKNKKKFGGGRASKNFLQIGAPQLLSKNISGIKKSKKQEKKLLGIIKTVFNKRGGKK